MRSKPRHGAFTAAIATTAVLAACAAQQQSSEDTPATIRLVDVFKTGMVRGGSAPRQLPRVELNAADWKAGPGVAGLAVRNGHVVGRSTSDFPVLYLTRASGFDNPDLVHAIEIRMKVSAGSKVFAHTVGEPTPSRRQVAMTRRAISPRLATRTRSGSGFVIVSTPLRSSSASR